MSHKQLRKLAIPLAFARKVSAIATDMDGTFFGTGLHVLETTRLAYDRAQKSRLPVIPATGRCLEGVADALQGAGVTNVSLFPGIYLNGCITFGPGGETDIICEHSVKWETVQKMVQFEKKLNEDWTSVPNWDLDPRICNAPPEHGFGAVTDFSLKKTLIALGGYTKRGLVFQEKTQLSHGVEQFKEGRIEYVGPLDEYARKHTIVKLLLVTYSGTLNELFRPDIIRLVGDDVGLCAAVPRILELTPKAASKAKSLAILASSLGIPLSCIASIGDGENDIDMLAETGFSIAMANGSEAVKEIASSLTDGNNEDGWALAVNCLLDAKEEALLDSDAQTGLPSPVPSTYSSLISE